ncbi:MAG TPA: pyrroloquinoline quinone biosynthesis protein PqqB [Terriglobales bacterium]
MHLKILGSAAGGGFPQWNCACPNCRAARRSNSTHKARSQAQLAVSSDGTFWFLLGASPDLRSQIESCAELQPRNGSRSSPIAGVVLAGADIDHTLGLLLLRELQPLQVYATDSVIHVLRDNNSMFGMLNRVPDQVRWQSIKPDQSFPLQIVGGENARISCLPIPLSSRYPAFVQNSALNPDEAVLGLILTSDSGKRVGYFPNVAELSEELVRQLNTVDLLLFDGTFYSDDELIHAQGSGQCAREMGHIPVSGSDGSLRQLAAIAGPRKMYIHINNTNPMLDESSAEHAEVRNAGWELAEDGWQTTL